MRHKRTKKAILPAIQINEICNHLLLMNLAQFSQKHPKKIFSPPTTVCHPHMHLTCPPKNLPLETQHSRLWGLSTLKKGGTHWEAPALFLSPLRLRTTPPCRIRHHGRSATFARKFAHTHSRCARLVYWYGPQLSRIYDTVYWEERVYS